MGASNSSEVPRDVSPTDNRSSYYSNSSPDDSTSLECELQAARYRNLSVTILKEILKGKIKLNESEEAKNNAVLKVFLETFIARMKECDETFKLLYRRVHYTGSYYSSLRIANADEFDLDLVLKFPFGARNLELEFKEEIASYGKLRRNNADIVGPAHANLLKKFFVDDHLIPETVRFWFHSVVDKALHFYPPPKGCVNVRQRTAGPARTIILTKDDGDVIDVDLVPVIEYTMTKRIPGIDDRVHTFMMEHIPVSCFLVPKPCNLTEESTYADRIECSQLWRLHFPVIEDKAIHDFGCVKPVIKLLKLLRDKNDWKILASYYLKTVVMWLILIYSCKDDWREDKMGDRLIQALKRLMLYVENRNIPYFFSTPHNLIAKMNLDQSVNISGRLQRIIRNIEANPCNLWAEFGVQPTFQV